MDPDFHRQRRPGKMHRLRPRSVLAPEDHEDEETESVRMVMTVASEAKCIGCAACAVTCSKKAFSLKPLSI